MEYKELGTHTKNVHKNTMHKKFKLKISYKCMHINIKNSIELKPTSISSDIRRVR